MRSDTGWGRSLSAGALPDCRGVARAPVLERAQRSVDHATQEGLAVVGVREWLTRDRNFEEIAQWLPAFARFPHQQAIGGHVALDAPVMGDHLLHQLLGLMPLRESALGPPEHAIDQL